MSFAKTLMPALAHDTIILNHDCPNQRVRLDVAPALLGQVQGAGHPSLTAIAHVVHFTQKETTKKRE
jgi:hypothetical protein